MINEMFVAAVTAFSGTMTPDKNGNFPVMLQCTAGKMPNRNVLSGTVAQRLGVEIGKTYLLQVREQGTDKQFGQDFTFVKVRELISGEDIVRTTKELGPPQVIAIQRPEGYEESYERKTVAVEGIRTKRIKEGLYVPSGPNTSTDHETAPEIVKGSSQESLNK